MSYLQSTSCGEIGKIIHIIFDTIIPYKTNGLFIEIGANDGKTGSFTYNLAKIGWHGINFEPIPRLYTMCCDNHKTHKNVKNYNIALGDKEEETVIIDAGTLSTMDKDVLNTYSNVPQFSIHFHNNNSHKVNVKTFDSILQENNITDIDILVLDVEGYEENVLKGFSIEKHYPRIFIIEIADQHPDFINNVAMMNKYRYLRDYFEKNNYTLLVNDIVDNVYIHNDIFKNLERNFIDNIKKMVNFQQFIK